MRMQRLLKGVSFGVVSGVLSLSAGYATVIDYENLTSIPLDYADRVDATGTDSQSRGGYNLTHGATPNVQVRMFSANYQDGSWSQLSTLFRWGSNYANLVNVAYHAPSNQGARFIFTADSAYYVRLHGFQMGGWPNLNQPLPFLQVLVDNNPVFTQTNITISGSTADTFSFDPNVVKGGVIEIRFGGNWNVGIDNIGFSQELIPEPASLLALGAGLAGLIGLRRRIH